MTYQSHAQSSEPATFSSLKHQFRGCCGYSVTLCSTYSNDTPMSLLHVVSDVPKPTAARTNYWYVVIRRHTSVILRKHDGAPYASKIVSA